MTIGRTFEVFSQVCACGLKLAIYQGEVVPDGMGRVLFAYGACGGW